MEPETYSIIAASAAIILLVVKIFSKNGCFITSPCCGEYVCVLDSNEGGDVAQMAMEAAAAASTSAASASAAAATPPAAAQRIFGSPYIVFIRDPSKTQQVLQRIEAAQERARS